MDMASFDSTHNSQIILRCIKNHGKQPLRFMEFCGGHTVAIFRSGIRQLLPPNITLISGPGCPVCVTSSGDLDLAISLASNPNLIITSFGDLLRVPGNHGTLLEARAHGADVRIVYSTLAALEIARQNPHKKVVFIGVGFETTAPTIAAAIKKAKEENFHNFLVLSLCKLTPPIMQTILSSGEINIDGIIAPGHVSSIIGSHAWQFIASDFRIPVVVSGFEDTDILYCIQKLIEQNNKQQALLQSAYTRSVSVQGNKVAQELLNEVFESTAAIWRGIGSVPSSGLKLKKEYAAYDAFAVLDLQSDSKSSETPGCICGDIVRGAKTPNECRLFQKGTCTPQQACGPCMVSSEGTCAAYYHYYSPTIREKRNG